MRQRTYGGVRGRSRKAPPTRLILYSEFHRKVWIAALRSQRRKAVIAKPERLWRSILVNNFLLLLNSRQMSIKWSLNFVTQTLIGCAAYINPKKLHHKYPTPNHIAMFNTLIMKPYNHQSLTVTYPIPKYIGADPVE